MMNENLYDVLCKNDGQLLAFPVFFIRTKMVTGGFLTSDFPAMPTE